VPDLTVEGGEVRRSRRLRLLLSLGVILAVVIAAAGFAVSLRTNWEATNHAVAEAHAASAQAEAAADQATMAAAHAEAAHRTADLAARDLCLFLRAVQGEHIDERQAAAKLYLEFRCAAVTP
jgi:type VI protein secretion system component VasK